MSDGFRVIVDEVFEKELFALSFNDEFKVKVKTYVKLTMYYKTKGSVAKASWGIPPKIKLVDDRTCIAWHLMEISTSIEAESLNFEHKKYKTGLFKLNNFNHIAIEFVNQYIAIHLGAIGKLGLGEKCRCKGSLGGAYLRKYEKALKNGANDISNAINDGIASALEDIAKHYMPPAAETYVVIPGRDFDINLIRARSNILKMMAEKFLKKPYSEEFLNDLAHFNGLDDVYKSLIGLKFAETLKDFDFAALEKSKAAFIKASDRLEEEYLSILPEERKELMNEDEKPLPASDLTLNLGALGDNLIEKPLYRNEVTKEVREFFDDYIKEMDFQDFFSLDRLVDFCNGVDPGIDRLFVVRPDEKLNALSNDESRDIYTNYLKCKEDLLNRIYVFHNLSRIATAFNVDIDNKIRPIIDPIYEVISREGARNSPSITYHTLEAECGNGKKVGRLLLPDYTDHFRKLFPGLLPDEPPLGDPQIGWTDPPKPAWLDDFSEVDILFQNEFSEFMPQRLTQYNSNIENLPNSIQDEIERTKYLINLDELRNREDLSDIQLDSIRDIEDIVRNLDLGKFDANLATRLNILNDKL